MKCNSSCPSVVSCRRRSISLVVWLMLRGSTYHPRKCRPLLKLRLLLRLQSYGPCFEFSSTMGNFYLICRDCCTRSTTCFGKACPGRGSQRVKRLLSLWKSCCSLRSFWPTMMLTFPLEGPVMPYHMVSECCYHTWCHIWRASVKVLGMFCY